MNVRCFKCSALGLSFLAEHIEPINYIEGNPSSKIWIIGLNPKAEIGSIEKRNIEDLAKFSPESHAYFKDFKKVSTKLYNNWNSKKSIIAHTDIVKCASNSFPPNGKKSDEKEIVSNCEKYLFEQILLHKPNVIICNGITVCNKIISKFPPPPKENDSESDTKLTSYKYKDEKQDYSFWVILSGFIGRIDDVNKRRIGKEIEDILDLEAINLD